MTAICGDELTTFSSAGFLIAKFRASEGTLSRWSRLYLQSLASTPVSRRVDVRQATGRKKKCRIFITWWKHVVPTPLSGIRVGKRFERKKERKYIYWTAHTSKTDTGVTKKNRSKYTQVTTIHGKCSPNGPKWWFLIAK
jgi:hypothetical protein